MPISWPQSNKFVKCGDPGLFMAKFLAMELIQLRFTTKDAKSTKENRFCLIRKKKKLFLRELRVLRGEYLLYASSVPT
jgi:hypothetical protein